MPAIKATGFLSLLKSFFVGPKLDQDKKFEEIYKSLEEIKTGADRLDDYINKSNRLNSEIDALVTAAQKADKREFNKRLKKVQTLEAECRDHVP
jgi:hypothetical protein